MIGLKSTWRRLGTPQNGSVTTKQHPVEPGPARHGRSADGFSEDSQGRAARAVAPIYGSHIMAHLTG